MEENTLLEVKDLRVVYKTDEATVHAVNGISFTLGERETIGLVGETGAGKTTTALTLLRLLPERTGRVLGGEIRFRGENLLEKTIPEMRHVRGAEISIIFQDPMTALNPALTVGDQVLESLEIHNLDKRSKEELDARVDELFKLVGIPPERKKEYPHQFSGGMKQRIVIAIALACQPQLLIADEPTTALDVSIQAQILNLLMDMQQDLGLTYMFITHNLAVVKHISDVIMVMYLGQCVEIAEADELFANPQHPYTKALLDAILKPVIGANSDRKLIRGEVTSPIDPAPGCRFAKRCEYCTEKCNAGEIKLVDIGGGHKVACTRCNG